MTYQIYALVDPCTSEVRYVGWSKDPEVRYRWHLDNAIDHVENTRKACWIRSLVRKNRYPELKILETGCGDWAAAERWWIKFYREEVGVRLTNMTDGGEGMSGFTYAPGSRENMSVAARRRWSCNRQSIIESQNRGKSIMTEDQRLMANDKRSLKQRGRIFTDDHRRKLSIALGGNRNNPERGPDGRTAQKSRNEFYAS